VQNAAPPDSGGSDVVSALIGFLVIAGIVALIVFVSNASSKQRRVAQATFQAHLADLVKNPLVPVTVPELELADGEVAYYASEAEIFGTHTRTRRVGYSGGPSFRIARGLYWHASSYASTPIRESYTIVDDKGRLIVTNERVLFIGSKNTYAWPFSKILSIQRFTDGVQISPENRKPVVFTTGSEDAAIVIDRARAGTLAKALAVRASTL
jgi:hypothetical protein